MEIGKWFELVINKSTHIWHMRDTAKATLTREIITFNVCIGQEERLESQWSEHLYEGVSVQTAIKARVSKKEKKEIGKEINKVNYICIIENTNKIKFSSFKRPNRFIFLSQDWNKREKPKLLIRNKKRGYNYRSYNF